MYMGCLKNLNVIHFAVRKYLEVSRVSSVNVTERHSVGARHARVGLPLCHHHCLSQTKMFVLKQRVSNLLHG